MTVKNEKKQCAKCSKCSHLNDLSKISDTATHLICDKCKVKTLLNGIEIIDFGASAEKKMEQKKKNTVQKKEEKERAHMVKRTGNLSPVVVSGNYPEPVRPRVRVGVDTDHLKLKNTKELRLALIGSGTAKGAKEQKLEGMGLVVSEQFSSVSDLNLEKMVSAFQLEFVKNENLFNCTPSSIAFAMIDAGRAGIYPDAKNGALIPRKNRKKECTELTFMPMARGIISAAMASGVAKRFDVQIVNEDDEFSVETDEFGNLKINHKINFKSDSKEIIAAYCQIFLQNGEKIVEILRKSDIEDFKAKSEAEKAKKEKWSKGKPVIETPWDEWLGEMIRKSVVKRACKYLPRPEERQQF